MSKRLALVLHNVRSAYNVGAIWRSAAAFGVSELILVGITPHPRVANDQRLPHAIRKAEEMVAKTALGAQRSVPFQYFPKIDQAVAFARKQGYKIYALEQAKQAIALSEFKPSQACALIIGNEVKGLPASLLNKSEAVVEIPMLGSKESLNVASATAVALYELTKN